MVIKKFLNFDLGSYSFSNHFFPSPMCSSYGQNLTTSTYILEILFSMVICILGLILFSYLLGKMQVSSLHYLLDIAINATLVCYINLN